MDAQRLPGSPQLEIGSAANSLSLSEILEQLTGILRRQFPIFVFMIAFALALSFIYLFVTPARYTAHAMMIIDSSKVRALQQQQALGDIPVDTTQVETQVEILKSESIALSVIKEMRLTEDPEFVGTGGGFVGAILGLVPRMFDLGAPVASEPVSEDSLTRRALGGFLGRRAITRVARTYVLDVAFTALSPNRAAQIANATADAYIVDQLESKYQVTRRASVWLQDRIKELRTQVMAADRAVFDYKEKNNIVDIGSAGGVRLLSDQQVSELNTQLITARAAEAESKARLERIDEVMKQDVPDAGVADALRSDVISRFRTTYLETAARERIYSARYGSTHLAAVNLRTQMSEIRRSIAAELGRIAESYKSDYEIAKVRVLTLEKNLADLVSDSRLTNRDKLGLRDLESSAQVYHTIHDNFLQRYMEAIQQQSFPITEARVISAASPPSSKTSPRTGLALAMATAFGLLLSFATAMFREAVDRVFRTTRQVEDLLRTNNLAVLPAIPNSLVAAAAAPKTVANKAAANKLRQAGDNKSRQVDDRLITTASMFSYVVDEPLSLFAEALRSVKVAIDIEAAIKENKVIGVTSTLPKEGKSTVASNLAELIAHAGKKVILLDGDLRNPTLTRNLAGGAKIGLLDVLSGRAEIKDVLYADERTGLAMLPSVIESRLAHSNEILASDAFKRLLDMLRKSYDYVIVDLPPIAPVVDARATTHVIDSYVFVIEWGRARTNVVAQQLAGAPQLHGRLLGAVLNKANLKVLDRYQGYYGRNYYKQYYARYGYPD